MIGALLALALGANFQPSVAPEYSPPPFSGTAASYTATSTGSAVVIPTNGKTCLNGSTCTTYLQFDGTNINATGGAFVTNGVTISASNITGTNTVRLTNICNSAATACVNPGSGTFDAASGGTVTLSVNGVSAIATTPTATTIAGTITASGGINCTDSTRCGSKTLSTGGGTQTVASGCRAICTDTTAAAAIKCSVSATTLTFTGTGSDVINWFCF